MSSSDLSLPDTNLLIDGRHLPATGGKVMNTLNPATGLPITQFAEAGPEDIDAAVLSAHRAFGAGVWSERPGIERGRVLWRVSERLREEEASLSMLESVDAGKPLAATKRQDLQAAIDCLAYYAGWADKIEGQVVPTRASAFTYIAQEPIGVVAAIVPWNFPLMNAVWKIAPALACGCSVVLKPAELTPLSALRLGQIFLECGLPPGVLNVVPGLGTVAGQALIEHPLVNKIAFTGSPKIGKHILRTASDRALSVGVELGGKSACVVFAGADLEAAARAVSSGAFFNAGQVCSAATRLFVEKSVHDEFLALLIKRASAIRTGDPLAPDTTMGPVISGKQQEGILNAIAEAKRQGATVAFEGKLPTLNGYFIAPTIFTGVRPDMMVAQNEIFGPVLGVAAFEGEQQAVELANNSRYSLAASVWTRDIGQAHRMARKVRAGTVWVNTYGPTDTRLPWGGMGGDSGFGRDLGREALHNYTERKTVWIQTG